MNDQELSRRRLLLGTASVSAIAIAGCLGDDEEDPEDEIADDDPDPEEETNDGMESDGDEDDEMEQEEDGEDTDDEEDLEDDEDGTIPEELPTDPDDADFVDMTGEDTVEVETREGGDGEPNFVFDPPFVRVDQGATIRWVNADGVFHTVTSTSSLGNRSGGGDLFDETISAEGDTFEWDAEESGIQPYYCSPHAGFMFGAIEVQE